MNSKLYEKKFKKEIDTLGDIFNFTNPFYSEFHIGEEIAYCINLAVEEIFTNMVKYNTTSQNDILISLEISDGFVEALLVDYDVDNFTPEKISNDDLDELRDIGSIGGRGVYLVHRVVDKLHYEYVDNNYVVKILKKME